jgi:citronellol/citronellal dehydrogenase
VSTLKGRTLFVTGASRGIGRAIALRAARDGANVIIAAKSTRPHAKLPGTIHDAAEELQAAGGRALAVKCDVRDEEQIAEAVGRGVETFGGIDVLVNNASALSLTGTQETTLKMYDRMFDVNARGSYACTQACLPHLLQSENPHVLNLAPPINLDARWFAHHAAYTVAKYAMSFWVLGMSEEFRERGVAFNALWPRTTIDTAAVRNLLGGEPMARKSRMPSIMADAAHTILVRDARSCTGHFYLDEDVLREIGVSDLSSYAVDASQELQGDLFL